MRLLEWGHAWAGGRSERVLGVTAREPVVTSSLCRGGRMNTRGVLRSRSGGLSLLREGGERGCISGFGRFASVVMSVG